MLTRLTVRDFQKHEAYELDLSRVTTLVGPNGAGKSCLLRALRWLAVNRPAGDAVVRRGADGAEVTLEFDGGRVAVRSKGAGGNGYALDGGEYKAFGKGKVPDAVRDALRLAETNFGRQLDGPYWLALSPGQLSREINEVVNLGLIDQSLGRASKTVRDAKSRKRETARRLRDAKRRRSELSWVPQAQAELGAVGAARRAADDGAARAAVVRRLADRLRAAEVTLADAATGRATALRMASAYQRAADLTARETRLRGLITQYKSLEGQCRHASQSASTLQSQLDSLLRKRCPLCQRGP